MAPEEVRTCSVPILTVMTIPPTVMSLVGGGVIVAVVVTEVVVVERGKGAVGRTGGRRKP